MAEGQFTIINHNLAKSTFLTLGFLVTKIILYSNSLVF